MRTSLAAILIFVAIVLVVLGAIELNDQTSMGAHSRHVFFGLAALALGAAAGVLWL